MRMERRGPQKLTHKRRTGSGLRADKSGNNSNDKDFQLEVQSNSWLRIGLVAKDKEKVFTNLFCHLNMENLREAFHALDGTKAVGVDGITKEQYGQNLEANLNDLLTRLHKGTYRPLPKRKAEIPKADGRMRPLAIASFEDKIVEWWCAKCLSTIYEMARYADDAVFCFKSEAEAVEFTNVLKERMTNSYKLTLHEEKTKTVDFGKRRKNAFSFLGFTFYWGKDRGSQTQRLKVKTEQKRLDKRAVEYGQWVKENRARMSTAELWEATNAKLRGHYDAFGVIGNRPRLYTYYYKVVGLLFRWLNRRSQKRSYTWEGFQMRMRQFPLLAPPATAKLKPLVDRRMYV